jgi:hypothetical protein
VTLGAAGGREESEGKDHHPHEGKLEGSAELKQTKEERHVLEDVSSSSSLEDVVSARQDRLWAERDSKGYRASRRS